MPNPAERWYAFSDEELPLIAAALELLHRASPSRRGRVAQLEGELSWAMATKPEASNVQD